MPKQPKTRPATPPPAEEQLTPRLKEIVRAVGAKLDAEDERQRLDETQPAPSVAQAETETDRPRWVDYTPEEPDYLLTMTEPEGGDAQMIHLTREEFILLKEDLGRSRGFEPEAPETE